MKPKSELKSYFENGDIPNQEQFWAWMDSYHHKDDAISMNNISGLKTALDEKLGKDTEIIVPLWTYKTSGWDKDIQVQHPDRNGLVYVSLVDNNTSVPGTDNTKWSPASGAEYKVEPFTLIPQGITYYAHYSGQRNEPGAYADTGFVRGIRKGDIIRYGLRNRKEYPAEETTGRILIALYDEQSIQRIKNIVVDTDVKLNTFIEGQFIAEQDCMLLAVSATNQVSDVVEEPYIERINYKTLTTKRKDSTNGYIDANNYNKNIEYIFPMLLNKRPELDHNEGRYASNFRCTEQFSVETGDVINYSIKIAPNKVDSDPFFYVLFYHENGNKIADIILQESNNLGQFINGSFTAYRKGKVSIASDLGTEQDRKTWFPHISVERTSNILKKENINTVLAGKEYVDKSLVNQFSIGMNYMIDSHKQNNNTYTRYDHIQMNMFNGGISATVQRFRTFGNDLQPSEIVTYISKNNGADWSIFSVKPYDKTSWEAEANPYTLLNNDGSLAIIFLKQIKGTGIRKLYLTHLNPDGTYSDETLLFESSYSNAPGGCPSLRIGDETFFTLYEEAGWHQDSWSRLLKYNHETKQITNMNVTVTGIGSPSESGIYDLPDNRWVMYYRTTTGFCRGRISSDNGLTWGEEFNLFRAPDSMTAIKRLKACNSLLQPIYVAAVSEWTFPSSTGATNDRRHQTLMVSVDGLNWHKMGNITRYTGEYLFFEPTIFETADSVHIGWSTIPDDLGGGVIGTTKGSVWNCIVDKRKIQDFTNGHLFQY
ncbi:hypothetical protein BAX94_15345 [Elizabethkingia meningoseptica]|uniref:Sialidase domain-containing protein n=1 Tax=Elizabethkingia meningoseptica TaxID=238 RepID=A0A1T3HZS9_ELIME|nr:MULTISPECIES: sialidase family protein [Elizabethkingia]AQX12264.1 hypothetical protein BBD35_07690 [Elizabethkingia meningoseptica]MBG0513785.1 exo-alpha-sialidase [Elizabethkingia meningoseptica]MDE5436230.1 glycoside hydrolase [Elizabethkingia meningoseptica]MDE5450549.1 glycoside hydrolase [Elizabethkingia meningoseptica]MDE5469546.1 glycoside hydrolase [Elizabethkingia meningoseptica]